VNWASAGEFFAMGGYAFYVWGSFLATVVCVAAELLLLRARRSEALRRVRAERMRHETTT